MTAWYPYSGTSHPWLWNIPHFVREAISIGLNFQRRVISSIRARKRRSCSSSLTENQYLIRIIPERMSMASNSGTERKNSRTSSSVQSFHPPPLYSTVVPAAVKEHTSPPQPADVARSVGNLHCVFSRSVGTGKATTRTMRGFNFR